MGEDLRGQANEKLPLFLTLAFLLLNGNGIYFRGTVPTLSQASSDMCTLTSIYLWGWGGFGCHIGEGGGTFPLLAPFIN